MIFLKWVNERKEETERTKADLKEKDQKEIKKKNEKEKLLVVTVITAALIEFWLLK